MDTKELRIQRTAAIQHGVITRRQILALGASDGLIRPRVGRGLWRTIGPGTYLATGKRSLDAVLAAAVSYLPAVVSHESAAVRHDLPIAPPRVGTVTIPHRSSNRFPDVTIHESTDLDAGYIEARNGLPTTTLSRTIFDLASVLDAYSLVRVVDHALSRSLVEKTELSAILSQLGRRGRPGTASFRVLMAKIGSEMVAPESVLERRMLDLIAQFDLPEPGRQMPVPWRTRSSGRVDLTYSDQRVIVECDGRRWHTASETFESDRRRDNLAQLGGWMVLRFTWHDVTRRSAETATQIRTALRVER
jgi:hypothetical protein